MNVLFFVLFCIFQYNFLWFSSLWSSQNYHMSVCFPENSSICFRACILLFSLGPHHSFFFHSFYCSHVFWNTQTSTQCFHHDHGSSVWRKASLNTWIGARLICWDIKSICLFKENHIKIDCSNQHWWNFMDFGPWICFMGYFKTECSAHIPS